MSLFDRLFGFGKDVVLLTEKTKNLSSNVEKLSAEAQGIDRRLIRLETRIDTIFDIARSQSGPRPPELPGTDQR